MPSTPTSEHGGPGEAPGAVLIGGRYEVVGTLGQGGFGTTHAAIDRQTGERVAVKVLDLRRIDDWKAVELFEREARVLQSLRHPGIPAYVEFRPLEADREAYLVQGLAAGESLGALLGRRRFTETELVDLARRVLEILQYLGSLHPVVVHRDIKPANIVLADDGTVSLVDFGAVRDIAAPGGGSTVAGTFGYMAPEQLQGEASPRWGRCVAATRRRRRRSLACAKRPSEPRPSVRRLGASRPSARSSVRRGPRGIASRSWRTTKGSRR